MVKMSSFGKLWTLGICSDQLFGFKNHNNFNLKNEYFEILQSS